MSRIQKLSLFLLRVSFGWLFLYAGITKVLDPEWTAKGYLEHASTFPGLYQWLAAPAILPIVDFLNEWGLTLIGASLLLGVFVRLSSLFAALLMLLYYVSVAEMRAFEFFPQITVPYIGLHSAIVDEHIIYLFALLALAAFKAGRVWGLDNKFSGDRAWLG